MKPDNSALFAWQNVYEPLQTKDNRWVVYYKDWTDWKKKLFITKDGAYVFYYQKINEFKKIYTDQHQLQK